MSDSFKNINVKVNYPQALDLSNEIESRIAKWILSQQIDNIGEEELRIAYPIWIRAKEIEKKQGVDFSIAKEKAIKEFS